MRTRIWIARGCAAVMLLAALAGATFAGTSTADFARHLDRDVHDLHCSLVPGAAAPPADAEHTGCRVALMSPYSSVQRDRYWGGVPVALPGLGTFAFLAVWAVFAAVRAGGFRLRHGVLGVLWWLLPVGASIYMGRLAYTELHAFCRLCVGIYASSAVGLVSALVMAFATRRSPGAAAAVRAHLAAGDDEAAGDEPEATAAQIVAPPSVWWSFPVAALTVAAPVAAYVGSLPDMSEYEGGCGTLASIDDEYDVLIPLSEGPVDAIEVMDPLCAACRAFEERLDASGLGGELGRRGLLFPLDSECNWMVRSSVHPGACAVSEAMLCEPARAGEVLRWAFENQESIMEAERARAGAAAELATTRFPYLRGCIGGVEVRSELHRGLRWAVRRELPVMTPQLFVAGRKLCNEDTDLGLEYMLRRLIASARSEAAP